MDTAQTVHIRDFAPIIKRRWFGFGIAVVLVLAGHLFWSQLESAARFKATAKIIIGADVVLAVPHRQGKIDLQPIEALSHDIKKATLLDPPVLRYAAQLARGDLAFVSRAVTCSPRLEVLLSYRAAVLRRFGDGPTGLEEIIDHLQAQASITTYTDRQIVELHVSGDECEAPLLFAWALAEAAQQFHADQALENLQRFRADLASECAETALLLQRAYDEMVSASEELAVANFAEKERLILSNVFRLEDQRIALSAVEDKNELLIKQYSEEVSPPSDLDDSASEWLEAVRQRLLAARLERESKAVLVTDQHPDIRHADDVIGGLEKAVADERERLALSLRQRNGRELARQNQLLRLEQEILGERVERLRSELADLNKRKHQYAPKELQYKMLHERVEHLDRVDKEAQWAARSKNGSILIYDLPARSERIERNVWRVSRMAVVLLLALLVGGAVACGLEQLDSRVRCERDLRRHLDLPILAAIPFDRESGGLVMRATLDSPLTERLNTTATLVRNDCQARGAKSILLVSATAGEGKTTMAVNLAVSLARKGARVVLIDGDLRAPRVHELLSLEKDRGLSTAIEYPAAAAMFSTEPRPERELFHDPSIDAYVIQRTALPTLHAVTSGPPAPDPVQFLESPRLSAFVVGLVQRYDFVIMDTPPMNAFGDALIYSGIFDACLFVVGSGRVEIDDVIIARRQLSTFAAQALGIILNFDRGRRGPEYRYYRRALRKSADRRGRKKSLRDSTPALDAVNA